MYGDFRVSHLFRCRQVFGTRLCKSLNINSNVVTVRSDRVEPRGHRSYFGFRICHSRFQRATLNVVVHPEYTSNFGSHKVFQTKYFIYLGWHEVPVSRHRIWILVGETPSMTQTFSHISNVQSDLARLVGFAKYVFETQSTTSASQRTTLNRPNWNQLRTHYRNLVQENPSFELEHSSPSKKKTKLQWHNNYVFLAKSKSGKSTFLLVYATRNGTSVNY